MPSLPSPKLRFENFLSAAGLQLLLLLPPPFSVGGWGRGAILSSSSSVRMWKEVSAALPSLSSLVCAAVRTPLHPSPPPRHRLSAKEGKSGKRFADSAAHTASPAVWELFPETRGLARKVPYVGIHEKMVPSLVLSSHPPFVPLLPMKALQLQEEDSGRGERGRGGRRLVCGPSSSSRVRRREGGETFSPLLLPRPLFSLLFPPSAESNLLQSRSSWTKKNEKEEGRKEQNQGRTRTDRLKIIFFLSFLHAVV